MKRYLPLLARILLVLIFVMSGADKLSYFGGTQAYMAEFGMPFTAFFLTAAIAVELLGVLAIVLGFEARWGACALILFLIPATLIFHTDFSQDVEVVMFLKNPSIIGGLLFVVAHGPGPFRLGGGSDVA